MRCKLIININANIPICIDPEKVQNQMEKQKKKETAIEPIKMQKSCR